MLGEPVYTLETLFEQLGMSSEPKDIQRFVEKNRLSRGTPLHQAPVWSPQQAAFLRAELERDAEWAEVIDVLNAAMH